MFSHLVASPYKFRLPVNCIIKSSYTSFPGRINYNKYERKFYNAGKRQLLEKRGTFHRAELRYDRRHPQQYSPAGSTVRSRTGGKTTGQGERAVQAQTEPGTGTVNHMKRRRGVPLYVWVNQSEYDTIRQRMEEAGTQNLSAYIRKMALNGYILNVNLAPIRELVSLQRRCANNLNQVAIHANTYGVYPSEIATLQKDYAELWGQVSDVLKQLAAVVEL